MEGEFKTVLHETVNGVAEEDQEHARALDLLRRSDTFVLIVKDTDEDGDEVARLLSVGDFGFTMSAGRVLAHAIQQQVVEILRCER